MAAVIKELSAHLDDGIGAVFSTWSLYVLIAAGAATMLLASHALAAGPLAASQPGFTILDPLAAGLLGVFLFGEHIRTGPADLAGEALALAAVVAAAMVLSRSCHTADPDNLPATSAACRGSGTWLTRCKEFQPRPTPGREWPAARKGSPRQAALPSGDWPIAQQPGW